MQKHDPKPQKKVEFHRLLGFAAVRDELGENIDFQAEIIEAKLGAKVGVEAGLLARISPSIVAATTTHSRPDARSEWVLRFSF